jgi:hypothetical protein
LQATLRNYYKNPMATGEDLFSMQDARNLIRYGGMRPTATGCSSTARIAGLVEYCRTLDMLKELMAGRRAAAFCTAVRCR